ncbi:MAG: Na+/H+ antiporter NhaA [Kofleriaceae bacterium]|nr:MAG: Na+/H+ antiporter NhaA [Kofleriaceae bacterium]MBZ0237084.1 Na+/H+ antiporter NhaA [Kofleriaceae bacterium]
MTGPEPLPPRPIKALTRPFVRFMELQASGGLVLVLATVVALVAANTALADDFAGLWNATFTIDLGGARLSYPVWYWINDGLMAIFFFVIGLEIKRELIWGELRDRRNVVLPALAALGGAVVPVGIYLALQRSGEARAGWAIPMATDIAFVVGCLAVLGPRVPPALKVFVLSLAIIDDMLAVIVIAVAFSSSIDLLWLGGAVGALALIYALNRAGVRRIGIYVAVGALVWLCTLKSGIHPTIAGVLLGLLTPATAWVAPDRLAAIVEQALPRIREEGESDAERKEAAETLAFAATESVSPLERLEHALHGWVAFAIMPLFALANAGVAVSADAMGAPVSVAVVAGLTLGKPIGIAGAAFLAIKLRLARLPERTSWPALAGASWLGGIGFTMALFIASLSLPPALLADAKSGILLGSALSLIGGMTVLALALRRAPAPG